jgi:hypothetical protein
MGTSRRIADKGFLGAEEAFILFSTSCANPLRNRSHGTEFAGLEEDFKKRLRRPLRHDLRD